MYAKYIIRKFLKKILSLVMFLIVIILNIVFSLFSKFISHIAVPVFFLGAVASLVYMIYAHDFDSTAVSIIVVAAITVLMKFTLPYASMYLKYAQDNLKDKISQPIITKSPVKYTL